jgi:hypothetical protein
VGHTIFVRHARPTAETRLLNFNAVAIVTFDPAYRDALEVDARRTMQCALEVYEVGLRLKTLCHLVELLIGRTNVVLDPIGVMLREQNVVDVRR